MWKVIKTLFSYFNHQIKSITSLNCNMTLIQFVFSRGDSALCSVTHYHTNRFTVLITLSRAKTTPYVSISSRRFFILIKSCTTYNENPLTLVVTLASTSRNVWYPRAYHNWNKTRKQRALVWRLSLRIPIGTFFTVTTLGVSYSKKIEPNAMLLQPGFLRYWDCDKFPKFNIAGVSLAM